MIKSKVLLASPIRQNSSILSFFLDSLSRLNIINFELHTAFIDDNVDPLSSDLLNNFNLGVSNRLWKAYSEDVYLTTSDSHVWNEHLIWKVANFKNHLIEYAVQNDFDYIFFVDSDLVLHPDTLIKLIAADKDIVSEVFWTSWQPNRMKLPQVWVSGNYDFFPAGQVFSDEEAHAISTDFVRLMYQPGLYRVGGLGACTLIKRAALEKGLTFSRIDNIPFMGEDRHFCIRARVLGLDLFAETTYPPLHIYREEDLKKVNDYIAFSARKIKTPHLTLSMAVRNESGRFLEQALLHHKSFIDRAVIIDDDSDDNTIEVIQNILTGKDLHIIRNDHSLFSQEHILRKRQWNETIATQPDWILNLDADQIFEKNVKALLKPILEQDRYRYVGFRLYDMWDEQNYRDDALWSAHQRPWPSLFRYTPFFDYQWNTRDQHCGHFPENLNFFELFDSQVRIKHLGWINNELRSEKYQRYMRLDPEAKYGVKEQYESILDQNPRVKRWID